MLNVGQMTALSSGDEISPSYFARGHTASKGMYLSSIQFVVFCAKLSLMSIKYNKQVTMQIRALKVNG
jgi:hypothetical protein